MIWLIEEIFQSDSHFQLVSSITPLLTRAHNTQWVWVGSRDLGRGQMACCFFVWL